MSTKADRRRANFGKGAGQVPRTSLRRWHDPRGHASPASPTPPASLPPRRGWSTRSFWAAWARKDAAERRSAAKAQDPAALLADRKRAAS